MNKPITVVFNADVTENLPLYHHYQGEIVAQPAYVELDLNTGEVDAIVSGEIGNGMPQAVWHGVVRRYPINNSLTREQISEAIESVREDLERIYSGGEVVMNDRSNWVGRLDNDAAMTDERLSNELIGADIETSATTNIAEYVGDRWPESAFPGAGETVADFVSDMASTNGDNNLWFVGDVKDALFDAWADILYQGDPLPQPVAQALMADGRCSDSLWTEELTSYARG